MIDTVKNFLIGLVVIVISTITLGIVFFTWPLLIGISSILLSVVVFVFFIVLIFYIIVLIGHLTRKVVKRK